MIIELNRWQANFGAVTISVVNERLEYRREIGVVRILKKSLLKIVRHPGRIGGCDKSDHFFCAERPSVRELSGERENIVRALLNILDVLSRLDLRSVCTLHLGDFNVVCTLLLGDI